MIVARLFPTGLILLLTVLDTIVSRLLCVVVHDRPVVTTNVDHDQFISTALPIAFL
jgi:hypothetical protein